MSDSLLLDNGLTPKQNAYKDEMLRQIKENGRPNGTQAVLKTYDTKNPKVAAVISSENLSNPNIRKPIEEEMNTVGLTREKLFGVLDKIVAIPVQKASAETVARTALELLKLTSHGKAESGGGNTYIFNNMSFSEAKKELESMSTKAEDFIVEAE